MASGKENTNSILVLNIKIYWEGIYYKAIKWALNFVKKKVHHLLFTADAHLLQNEMSANGKHCLLLHRKNLVHQSLHCYPLFVTIK